MQIAHYQRLWKDKWETVQIWARPEFGASFLFWPFCTSHSTARLTTVTAESCLTFYTNWINAQVLVLGQGPPSPCSSPRVNNTAVFINMEISVVIRGEAKVVFCFVFARTQRGGFLAQDENANFPTPHDFGGNWKSSAASGKWRWKARAFGRFDKPRRLGCLWALGWLLGEDFQSWQRQSFSTL